MVKKFGMTRLELSICEDAIRCFSPWDTSVRTLWHEKAELALDKIVIAINSVPNIKNLVYWNIDISKLICLLGVSQLNLLVIGR